MAETLPKKTNLRCRAAALMRLHAGSRSQRQGHRYGGLGDGCLCGGREEALPTRDRAVFEELLAFGSREGSPAQAWFDVLRWSPMTLIRSSSIRTKEGPKLFVSATNVYAGRPACRTGC
jgi:hypothetical protein